MNRDTLILAMGNDVISDEEVAAFNQAMVEADITTIARAAMWCAQLGEESAGLRYYEEIASGWEYEGRNDLGNTQIGDGVRFKGRGPIQVTGRHNYTLLSQWAFDKGYISSPTLFVDTPSVLGEISYGFLGAVWYWTTQRPLNDLADRGDVYGATRAINGGLNGIDDRVRRYNECRNLGEAILPTQEAPMSDLTPEQDVQLQTRGPGFEGWPARRYDKGEPDSDTQPRFSMLDFNREVDKKVNSVLGLEDRPGPEQDDLFGHILSMRAELRKMLAIQAEILQKLKAP